MCYFWFLIGTCEPSFFRFLITYLESENVYMWQGLVLAFTIFCNSSVASLMTNQLLHTGFMAGMRSRSIVNAAVYRKVSISALHWCHSSVSNHWQLDYLINSMINLIIQKISKVCITHPLWGESAGDWRIPFTQGQYMQKALPIHHYTTTTDTLSCDENIITSNKDSSFFVKWQLLVQPVTKFDIFALVNV